MATRHSLGLLRSHTQEDEPLNKAQLASQVAAELALPKGAADRILGAVFSTIAAALAREERVAVAGFRTFSTRARKAHTARNPLRPERRRCRLYSSNFQASQVPSRDRKRAHDVNACAPETDDVW